MKILVTSNSLAKSINAEAMNRLRAFSDDIILNGKGRPLTEDELLEVIEDVDGFIAGTDKVTAKVIEKAKKLKVISRYGAGVDAVDLAAAKAKGIPVTNTPGANSQAVAELAFGMMLSLARKCEYQSRQLKEGTWTNVICKQLHGKNLGIIGFGNIGRRFAKMSRGLDMKVLAYDPYLSKEVIEAGGADKDCTLEEIFRFSDVITLHLPLNDETRHMIDRDAIALMRDGVILINTARGGIIDEEAVCEGIESGKIWGVGLDVYEKEPPMGSKLFQYDNVISTPHTGAHTIEAVQNMGNMAVDNLIMILSGQDCPCIVNR